MAERLPDEWASALPSPGMVTLPPQRQLRQKLGCAYHPEGRLFIYIDNCGVFCWNGRFRAVRHSYGFKGGCCAEEVVYLHGAILSLFNAVLRTTSQSASQPAPLVGEPLASRETLSWTLEAQYGAKWRASLQRAAASGQCTLSSCRESRQRSTIASDKSSFVRPAWAWPICQGLPYQGSWQSRQALTERFFRARAL